jgi:hypothetical protein
MNFEAVPVAGHLLRIAVAHAGGFLEASEARCSVLTVAMRPWPPTPFALLEDASAFTLLPLLCWPVVPMDKASQVLTQGLPPDVPTSYRALADHGEVPRSTLHARAQGRRSIEEKAQSQQYLSPWEEDALVKFLLQMSDLGQPVRIKFIPFLAFCVRQRSEQARPPKPPNKNWARAFEKRHPDTQARRVTSLDWNRHEKNTY